MAKFCNECGYKFDKEYKFCPECGTKVQSIKNKRDNKIVKNTVSNDQEKKLEPKVIYGILVGGIAVIAIILLTSGLLDSTPVVNTPINQNQQQLGNNPGVNLNNMKMINDLEVKVKQNPEDYKSLLELAHLKNDSGLYEKAIQDYKTYLVKNP
ncbi:MAG: hypothetical protein Q8M94_20445, partial [Ignavibacteria bacterium]|nr:hypothetical protein [Ignavibacteria bacterium]